MLNRVAESFYWIGRYTERIDYTARLVDVNLYAHHRLLDKQNHAIDLEGRMAGVLSNIPSEARGKIDLQPSNLLKYMTFDRNYRNSILNCLSMARDNVRSVRQYATNRMWDKINTFYLWFLGQKGTEQTPFLFFERIRNEVLLFQSIADSSMLHEIEWRFMQAGEQLERTENAVRMMQMFLYSINGDTLKDIYGDYHRLITLLESVDGFETFRRVHKDEVKLDKVIEFLFLNPVFPGSVYYSLYELEENLKGLQIEFQLDHLTKVIRQVNRLRALIYQCLDLKGKTCEQHRDFLANIVTGCNQIGQEIEKCFVYDREEEVIENLPRKLAEMV